MKLTLSIAISIVLVCLLISFTRGCDHFASGSFNNRVVNSDAFWKAGSGKHDYMTFVVPRDEYDTPQEPVYNDVAISKKRTIKDLLTK